jgi:hypothetical protein
VKKGSSKLQAFKKRKKEKERKRQLNLDVINETAREQNETVQ